MVCLARYPVSNSGRNRCYRERTLNISIPGIHLGWMKGKMCLVFSKAFDKVSREFFVNKLQKCVLDKTSIMWIDNCFNRYKERDIIRDPGSLS